MSAWQVTGPGPDSEGFCCHAFLWDGTTMLDLGTLQGRPNSPREVRSEGYWASLASECQALYRRL